ncbi:hypothetical protein LPW41_01085 [Microbacterium sp. JC 701]|uniref:hypothetical protein n=1 Tax=Microbacterium sp. JC 701 TaxID=2897389 RepID=UPI001E317BBA|nr:hypothetical protein [Microbacterium sp. JC 701]MCD2168284.1 hypothetical protein [Microbacterium sp. JC 701]
MTTESAKQLRDLASLARDFELAEAYLDHYLAGDIEGDERYSSPLDAMWMTAVIFYARAFANGVRHTAKPELKDASPDEERMHEYVLDVRNKYLAHSVNGFESVDVVAFLTASSFSKPAIAGIGHVHNALSRMDRHSAEGFRQLCRRHLRTLRQRMESMHVEITQEILEMGLDAAYALKDYSDVHIDQSAAGRRRK